MLLEFYGCLFHDHMAAELGVDAQHLLDKAESLPGLQGIFLPRDLVVGIGPEAFGFADLRILQLSILYGLYNRSRLWN